MQVEDDHQLPLVSPLYSALYTDEANPPQGDQPRRRRRRKNKGEGRGGLLKKRKLSEEQAKMLEISFGCEHKLESERKDRLAMELGLDPRQVAVWFQNRRARWKNKKLEEEYSKLRNQHDTLVVDKCRLQSQVLSLKDQLEYAKMEIEKLREKPRSSSSADNVSINSPSSSLTTDQHQANSVVMDDPQMLGAPQFGIGGCFDSMFYVPDADYESTIDWVLYDIN